MKNAIILHGTAGSPEGNWFRWLETRLKAKGFEVWLPRLPNAERPSLNEWRDFVYENCPFLLNEETVIIGHSSGAALALALASDSEKILGAIVAVAPFVPRPDVYEATAWEANVRLFDIEFDWGVVRRSAAKRIIVGSDTDPYIPRSVFEYIAVNAGVELLLLPNQGHLNLEESPNYKEFPVLLSLLMEQGIVNSDVIQIVDENDIPLRGGTKQEVQAEGLWHRIVRVMVEDDAGNVLLQKRSPVMLMNPNQWDNSSAGHVDLGEDWLQAAERELSEEIGLKRVNLKEWCRYKSESYESDGRVIRRFNVLYRTVIPRNTQLVPQTEEISEIRWFSRKDLIALIKEPSNLVTDGLKRTVEDFYEDK